MRVRWLHMGSPLRYLVHIVSKREVLETELVSWKKCHDAAEAHPTRRLLAAVVVAVERELLELDDVLEAIMASVEEHHQHGDGCAGIGMEEGCTTLRRQRSLIKAYGTGKCEYCQHAKCDPTIICCPDFGDRDRCDFCSLRRQT